MVTARRVGRWALYGVGAAVALVVLVRVGVGVYLFITGNQEMKQQSAFVMPVLSDRSAGLVFQSAL